MDKSLELEFAKFETEVARTEMYGTMLDDALNMYNYVRYNGINRTFARLSGDNISSLLNRPIDINNIPVVGSPRDKLSLLFLVAMEDDATAGTGAATTAGATTTAAPTTGTTTTTQTATGTNAAPAANNAKQQGIFSKIWAFIRRILGNITKFFKGVFKKAMNLLLFRRKQIEEEIKKLDLKNMKDVDVRVMDYKQVHHDFKRWYAAGLKVTKIAKELEQNITSNPAELTKLSATAKAELNAELKEGLKELVSDDAVRKSTNFAIAKKQGPLAGAGNPKFVNNMVTEINAVIGMIGMIQKGGADLSTTIENASKPINDELARLEKNKNPSADDKLKLNAYRQAAQVLLDMTKFAEKMTSWNGKKADGVLKDLQNLGKAAGVESNANPAENKIEAASTEMAAEAQAEKK